MDSHMRGRLLYFCRSRKLLKMLFSPTKLLRDGIWNGSFFKKGLHYMTYMICLLSQMFEVGGKALSKQPLESDLTVGETKCTLMPYPAIEELWCEASLHTRGP